MAPPKEDIRTRKSGNNRGKKTVEHLKNEIKGVKEDTMRRIVELEGEVLTLKVEVRRLKEEAIAWDGELKSLEERMRIIEMKNISESGKGPLKHAAVEEIIEIHDSELPALPTTMEKVKRFVPKRDDEVEFPESPIVGPFERVEEDWEKKVQTAKGSREGLHDPKRPLTYEKEQSMEMLLSAKDPGAHLVTIADHTCLYGTLQCLLPKTWLRSEFINSMLVLYKNREFDIPGMIKSSYYFNTYFLTKCLSTAPHYRDWWHKQHSKGGINMMEDILYS